MLRRETRLLVAVYLTVIAVTLWVSGELGKWASVVDSGVGIGLVMVLRARLHDLWQTHRTRWMTALVAAGGLAAYLVNVDHPRIAIASVTAFAVASLAAAASYEFRKRQGVRWRERLFRSHLAFAFVDSMIFPAIAFSGFDWAVTGGQFGAKMLGATFYGELLAGLFRRHDQQYLAEFSAAT